MIEGRVTEDGIPVITTPVANKDWPAIVDTGFNGDLELPEALRESVSPVFCYQGRSVLAGGKSVWEDLYQVNFPFDGKILEAIASFVPGDEILIGTHLLRRHRVAIDFPAESVLIQEGQETNGKVS